MKTAAPVHPLNPRTHVYCSKYGSTNFVFCFQQRMDGRCRGYLVLRANVTPSVCGSESPVETAANQFAYVAFTEPVASFEAARRLAAFWADAAEKYRQQ